MYPDHREPLAPNDDPVLRQTDSLRRLAESAEYVNQRILQLDDQVREAEHTVQEMNGLARQLRTLASNTTLEATRMKVGGPLTEIARQMRRLAQRMSESNDQLALTIRSYSVTTGELRQAGSGLVVDAKSVRPRDMASRATGAGALPGPGQAGGNGHAPGAFTDAKLAEENG